MVMAIRRTRETLLKVAGSKLKISSKGHTVNIWIDSGSPISILTVDDLKKTLGRTGINLKLKNTEDDIFPVCSNNQYILLGKMDVEFASNSWKTTAEIRVIGGNRPSIVGRDLMGKLGLQVMQTNPRGRVLNLQGVEMPQGMRKQENQRTRTWTLKQHY